MIKIDKNNRQIIITHDRTKDVRIIKEFEKIEKVFLDGTEDIYECELILLEVPVQDDSTLFHNSQIEPKLETKAFARRIGVGFENWLEDINETDFVL